MLKPRTSFATILVGSKIYIFGGETCVSRKKSLCLNEKIDPNFDGTVEVLDLAKPSNSPLQEFPIRMVEDRMICNRASHTASLYKNRFVILQGGRVRPPKNSTERVTTM